MILPQTACTATGCSNTATPTVNTHECMEVSAAAVQHLLQWKL